MIANPLYSKYKTYKLSPQRSPDEMPSERTRIILGANVGITFTLSLFTYILGFTNFLNYRFSYIVFSNTTTHSILTPPTWAYYIQWINYALLLIPLCMHIWKCGNKQTMLKLYDMAYYMIPVNLLQTINNLFAYNEPMFYILSFFSYIAIISITTALFVRENTFVRGDECLKTFAIDIPISFYYYTCIINVIFILNNILHEIDTKFIYDESVFFGLMCILFVCNVAVLLGTRNIFQSFIYLVLMTSYFIKTLDISDINNINNINDISDIFNTSSNNSTNVTENMVYNMRVTITIPSILTSIMVSFIMHLHYKHKPQTEELEEELEEEKQEETEEYQTFSNDKLEELKEQII